MYINEKIITVTKFKCEYVLPFIPSKRVCVLLDMVCCILYISIFQNVIYNIRFINRDIFIQSRDKLHAALIIFLLSLVVRKILSVYSSTYEVTCIADLNVASNFLMLKYDKFNSYTLYTFNDVQRRNIKVIDANNFIITGKPELIIADDSSITGKKINDEICIHIRVQDSKEVVDEIIL